jgi:glycosyltransferase involved in cell wall biosynthesis
MKTCLLITTFNRARQLSNSLARLENLTLPDEILIVDDGSSDYTQAVAEEFAKRLPIKYIYNHNPDWSICSMARNIGVKNTDADIIITSEPELLWITDIIPQMMADREKHPDEIISAGIIYHAQVDTAFNPGLIKDPKSALKDEIVEEYVTEPRPYNQSGYVRTKNMQATFACLYERKWLLEVGGWDEGFKGSWGWDDIDLATRLRIKGINQHICPEMMAIHQWHEHLPPHLMGEASQTNENHMAQKKLNEVTDRNDPRLVANVGVEWGVINGR